MRTPHRTIRYEVQEMVVDPSNDDPDWQQVSLPDTASTARTHARQQCRRGPGTVTRWLADGVEQERYEYTPSGARKVRMAA